MSRIVITLILSALCFLSTNAQLASGDIAPNCSDDLAYFTTNGDGRFIRYQDMRLIVGDTIGPYKSAVIIELTNQKIYVDQDILSIVAGASGQIFAVTDLFKNKLIAVSANDVAEITQDKQNRTNIILYPETQFSGKQRLVVKESFSDVTTALTSCTGGGGSGQTNTASNLGAGEGIFAQKVGSDLQYKSLVAGTNVTLSSDGNEITINAGGGGQTNTASNLGAGEGVFAQKVGSDLQLKSLNAGTNITLTSDANGITINSTGGGGGSKSVYDSGLGHYAYATSGVTTTSSAAGVYDIDVPAGADFNSITFAITAANQFTGSGEIVLNFDWNTAAFNTSDANALRPNVSLVVQSGVQFAPADAGVTVDHTSFSGGESSTTIANLSGAGTPIYVKVTF